jgi:hypothetical protein
LIVLQHQSLFLSFLILDPLIPNFYHIEEPWSPITSHRQPDCSHAALSTTITFELHSYIMVESKKDRIRLEAGGHHHSSSRGQSSKSDKKHKKDRESGGSNDTKQPKAGCHWEWFWACHECGQSAGLTQHTDYCPDCDHLRCTDCQGDWVEIRDAA